MVVPTMAWLLLASNDTQSLEANPIRRIYLIPMSHSEGVIQAREAGQRVRFDGWSGYL